MIISIVIEIEIFNLKKLSCECLPKFDGVTADSNLKNAY